MIRIDLPLTKPAASPLRAGDTAMLSGVIYTARDAAHKRLYEMLQSGDELPFELREAVIYYAGPTAAPPGHVTGSIGPTTSSRMDAYTPTLLQNGMAGIIGKGARSQEVADAICASGAVYFAAIGGAGALLATRVKSSEVVAFPELGAEAIRRLVVEDFPVIVAIDSNGGNIYETGRAAYLASLK